MLATDQSEAVRKQNRDFFRFLAVDKNECKSILIYLAFSFHTEYKKKNQKFSLPINDRKRAGKRTMTALCK